MFYKKKELLFQVIINTFCFAQSNEYSKNEESCQGVKIDKGDEIEYILKKKDIDMAHKDKNIDPEFTVFKILLFVAIFRVSF